MRSPRNAVAAAAVAVLVLLPFVASDFFVVFVMTRAVMLGLAASTIVFLSSYGGMVSLAQLLFVGVAGFMVGNVVGEGGTKGLKLGWDPWVGVRVRARRRRRCWRSGSGRWRRARRASTS